MTGRQVEQGPVLGPLQETIEIFPESISPGGIVAGEVLEVGAHEDQAARVERMNEALLHDSTAARVGALFQLLVQDTTAQDFGLPSSAIRLRM